MQSPWYMKDLIITRDEIHRPSLVESVEIRHISCPPSAAGVGSVEIQDTPSPQSGDESHETQANTDDPVPHAPKISTESIIHRTTNPFHPPIPQTVNAQAKPTHYYSVSPIHIDPSVYSCTGVTPPHSSMHGTSATSFTTVFGGKRETFVGGEEIEVKHGLCSCCCS